MEIDDIFFLKKTNEVVNEKKYILDDKYEIINLKWDENVQIKGKYSFAKR